MFEEGKLKVCSLVDMSISDVCWRWIISVALGSNESVC